MSKVETYEFEPLDFGDAIALKEALHCALEAMARYGATGDAMDLVASLYAASIVAHSKSLDNRIEQDKKKVK